MAKGKHSTALFEVIHSAKEPGRIAQRMSTPTWWFKSRHRTGQTTGESQNTSRASQQQQQSPQPPEVETRRPEPRKPEKRAHAGANYAPRSSAIRVGFNRARKEFALRFRYTTALMCGFGLFAVVGVAYVAGRHMTAGPQTAAAAENQVLAQQLAEQPVRPSVMNVSKPRANGVAAAPRSADTPKQTALSNENSNPIKTVVSSLVPASADTELPRVIHLNYVVIATYVVEDQAKAEAARAYFTKAGIPCTLETTGKWAPKMISLVGTAGFTKVSAKDFLAYKDNIVKIAKTMKTSQFDKPSPGVYNWKGDPTDHTFSVN